MPEFGNAFSGLTTGRQVTHEELVRAIRLMVAAEYEAVQLYMQLAEATDHRLAKAVLKDIADEEIVHAGEFLTLLKELAPYEADFYAEGEREVRELMAGLGGSTPGGESRTAEAAAESGETEATRKAEPAVATVGNLVGAVR